MHTTTDFTTDTETLLELCELPERRRVLLIEDDELQAVAMKRWLEAINGVVVTVADTGFAAESYLKSDVSWATIVSDIDLPGLTGLELLEACKDRHPDTPVLLVTAHRRFEYALKAIRGGAADLLVKPLRREHLQVKIRGLLAAVPFHTAREPRKTVLAIGAHPDDVEIGCGGALLMHARRGDRVTVMTMTGGEAGGEPHLRASESRAAAVALGADLHMLSLPDRSVSEGPESISEIERVVREVQPDIIYTHSLNDAHQDHRAVHRATMVASRGTPSVYCYQAPSSTVDFRPNHFVNIADAMDAKIELLELYATQHDRRAYMKPNHVRSVSEYWGRFADYAVVEAFEIAHRSA